MINIMFCLGCEFLQILMINIMFCLGCEFLQIFFTLKKRNNSDRFAD